MKSSCFLLSTHLGSLKLLTVVIAWLYYWTKPNFSNKQEAIVPALPIPPLQWQITLFLFTNFSKIGFITMLSNSPGLFGGAAISTMGYTRSSIPYFWQAFLYRSRSHPMVLSSYLSSKHTIKSTLRYSLKNLQSVLMHRWWDFPSRPLAKFLPGAEQIPKALNFFSFWVGLKSEVTKP